MPALTRISNKYQFQIPNFKSKFGHWKAKFRFAKLEIGNWKFKRAFSLIELLVVITIISILLASATYSYSSAQRKGRDGKRKADMKTVQQALELYYQNFAQYAGDSGAGQIRCYDTTDPNGGVIAWGSAFTCKDGVNTPTFLEKTPKEVKPSGSNEYYYEATGTSGNPIDNCGISGAALVCNSYTISAVLENTNDPDKCTPGVDCTSKLGCEPQSDYNYCVKNP